MIFLIKTIYVIPDIIYVLGVENTREITRLLIYNITVLLFINVAQWRLRYA